MTASDLREQLQASLGAAYTLERELGGGGMSRVFVAHDESLGRDVVVKVLSPELAEGLSAERFTREVKLASRLQHPNVVPVLSAGALDARGGALPFYMMPFIDGASLRERLAAGPLPLAEALAVLRDVLRALAYAHARGVVHRDVKPENVLLTGGAAVVTDFGIAKALAAATADGAALTQLGTAVGTPAYMAPEQAAGDPGVDQRADLYAWGLVAWEVLAGRHPFADRKSAVALIGAQLTQTPEPLERVCADAPRALAALVARCLAKEPVDRPAAALDALRALDAVSLTPTEPLAAAVRAPREVAGHATAPSVAVLPFANVGAHADDEYFSDGMSEEVINALARLPGLRVAARTSSFAFKGRQVDLRTIAEQLGVRTILEGSVRRAGSRVRIAVQLASAADGLHLWSERYDRELADVFALQDEIGQAIASALARQLGGAPARSDAPAERQPARGAVNPAAYEFYLRGRFLFEQHQATQALACFERAAALDPDFAPAHAWAGMANILATNLRILPTSTGYPAGRAAGERARALDPRLPEALICAAAVALWYDWDAPRAEALAREAISIAPSFPIAHEFVAWALMVAGLVEEGLAAMERAYRMDPLSDFMLYNYALDLTFVGREGQAIELLRAALDRAPDNGGLHCRLGAALFVAGRQPEARAVLERARALMPAHHETCTTLACVLAATGEADAARALLEEARWMAERGQGAAIDVACACHWLGDDDGAFRWLDRAVETREAWMVWLHREPRLRRLHGDPRFDALLRRIGVAARC